MRKIGFQCQFDSKEALLYNREVLPAAWMAINVVKAAWLEEMVAVNPSARRIFRHHPNRPWADDPERQAVEAVAHIGQMMAGVGRFFTHVTDNNEFILGPDHVSADLIARADRYISTFIPTARVELGMGTCWGNFNVGHWGGGPTGGVEIMDHFPLSLAAAQQDRDSPISFHDYNWRLLRDDTLSYVGRWVKAMPDILERYPGVKCMVTELGIDRPAREWGADHEGWRMAFADPGQAVEMFCGDQGLRWVNDLANQYDWMLGLLLFGCGMVEPWRPQGFDIMNHENDVAVMDRIKQFPVVVPPEPPPPEPPNGGNEVVEVYDFDGVKRDWAWLVSVFGPKLKIVPVEERFPPKIGDRIYKVDCIRAKRGYAACLIQVKDLNGNPVAGKTVVWGWSDASAHGLENKGWNWSTIGDPGPTNETGDVGPGMGTGAYYHPDDPDDDVGPHWCWVHDRPSDYVEGIGMLSMTFHDHPDIGYREVIYQGDEPPTPPTPPTPPDADLVAALNRIGDELAGIRRALEGQPPEPPLPPPPPPAETFKGEYFNNTGLSGPPALTREDAEINLDCGLGSPAPGINADDFSVRWTGARTFEAGAYRFKARTDDGFRLWVDGALIIDQWKLQSPTDYEATVTLSAGQHDIRVEYFERGGGAVAQLSWEKIAEP